MNIDWDLVLKIAAGVVVVQSVLREVFGLNVLGRKIYKGAPIAWKWIMRSAIHRRDTDAKLNRIEAAVEIIKGEVTYNGGHSTKDVLKKVEQKVIEIDKCVNFNALRLDVNDVSNDRMTFRFDPEKGCTFVNDVMVKKLEITERDLLGYSFINIIHEDDREEIMSAWQRCIERKCRLTQEVRLVSATGIETPIIVRGFPHVIDDKLIEFYGTAEFLNKKK